MSNDDRRNLLFNAQELDNLRRECRINSIDFSRARIQTAAGGGYRVLFDKPLFDLGNVLLDPPSEVDARTAPIAEGLMLQGLMQIQRSERLRARVGRCYGLSPDQVVRRPLSPEEISEYKAMVQHKKEVARLTRELETVVQTNVKNAAAAAGKTDLESRYDLKSAKPEKAETPVPLPSANPKRAPSRARSK